MASCWVTSLLYLSAMHTSAYTLYIIWVEEACDGLEALIYSMIVGSPNQFVVSRVFLNIGMIYGVLDVPKRLVGVWWV